MGRVEMEGLGRGFDHFVPGVDCLHKNISPPDQLFGEGVLPWSGRDQQYVADCDCHSPSCHQTACLWLEFVMPLQRDKWLAV